ncbi:MAG: hypothetical protein U1A27_01415 [Phycisphaerae bacterium]
MSHAPSESATQKPGSLRVRRPSRTSTRAPLRSRSTSASGTA